MKHQTSTLFLLHQPVVIGWFACALAWAGLVLRTPHNSYAAILPLMKEVYDQNRG